MAKYTVKDTETGKKITFDWSGDVPPTEADLQEVFSAAKDFKREPNGITGEWEENKLLPDPKKMLENVPESAAKTAEGIWEGVKNPIGVITGLANLSGGLTEKAGRSLGIVRGEPSPQEEAVNQVAASLKEVAQNPGGYLEEDPVGALMNASGALSVAGKMSKIGKVAKVAEYANPVTATTKAVATPASWLAKKTKAGEFFYESAMKIPPSVARNIRQKAIETGLDYRYVVSDKGMEKLLNAIGDQNKRIATAIDKLQDSGKEINLEAAASRIDELKKFYENYSTPQKYLDDLDAIKEEIIASHGKTISPEKAQKMKQTIYAVNRKHYGEMKTASIEADKAIARGLKEELVQQYPELADLNATDSALLNLEEFLERAVNRSRNYDVVKLGDTIMTVTGEPTLVIGRRILESPGLKSRLGIALNKAAKKRGAISAFARTPELTSAPFIGGELLNSEPRLER